MVLATACIWKVKKLLLEGFFSAGNNGTACDLLPYLINTQAEFQMDAACGFWSCGFMLQ